MTVSLHVLMESTQIKFNAYNAKVIVKNVIQINAKYVLTTFFIIINNVYKIALKDFIPLSNYINYLKQYLIYLIDYNT